MIRDDEILNIRLNLLEITSVIFEFGHWMVSSESQVKKITFVFQHLLALLRLRSLCFCNKKQR